MDQARLALIITLAIQSLAAWGMMAGPVLAPLAAKDIGVEPYLVGVYVSVAYAAAACAGLASGSFIARFGPLRLSQGCLALVGAALLLAVLGTPLALLVAAVVVGIGYGPITPASSQLLARTTPPARLNLVFSLKQTGVPIGNSLAGAILPSLGLVIGWRGAALVTAVLCFAVTAAAEPLRRPLDVDLDRERPLFSLGQLAGPLRLVLASPELRRLALTSFAYAGMQTSLTTFLVIFLNGPVGLSVVAAGVALAAAQGAGVLGRIFLGHIADRFIPPMRLLGLLGLTMSVCSVLVGSFAAGWPFAAILAVCCAFGGTATAWNGVQLAQVAKHAPKGRAGEVTGGSSFVTFLGVVVVPAVFSALLGSFGSYRIGYTAVAVLTLLSGISYLAGKGLPRRGRDR